MTQQATRRKPIEAEEVTEIPADEARAALGDLLDRAGFRGERIAITRHGKRIAVLVSLEDLETLGAA
jgi:prevent-host-death family protein